MIIIDDIDQLSDEWNRLRIANPGASSASKIITSTGKSSSQADKYLLQLFDEAILNRKTPTFQSQRMKEGILYEDESFNYRNAILAAQGYELRKVALCYKDEKKLFHISPDGLCEELKQGFETKDALPHIQRERLKKGKLPTEHFVQVQMSLYVTEYDTWCYQSYCRNMPVLSLIIEPDLEFHKKLERELYKFCGKLQKMIKEYK